MFRSYGRAIKYRYNRRNQHGHYRELPGNLTATDRRQPYLEAIGHAVELRVDAAAPAKATDGIFGTEYRALDA